MHEQKTVGVIGAGVAGLATATYAAANGYRVTVWEQGHHCGGLCTSWQRKGYTFDGCIHWLVGAKPGTSFYPMWQAAGALEGTEFLHHDAFMRYEDGEGAVTFWADADRLKSELLRVAPEDAEPISELMKAVRTIIRHPAMPIQTAPDLMGGWAIAKMIVSMLPVIGLQRRYTAISFGQFSERFSNRLLRRTIRHLLLDPRVSVNSGIYTLAWYASGDAAWPVGGSLAFARRMEARARKLGVEFVYDARVERILVEKDRAAGVRLSDGTEQRADFVVSAADGHGTLFGLLEDRYTGDMLRRYYEQADTYQPFCQLSLGVDRDFKDEPRSIVSLLGQPMDTGGLQSDWIWISHYAFDPTMAPTGKSVVQAYVPGNYEHWLALKQQGDTAYSAEKERVAGLMLDAVEHRFPGTRARLEVQDLATPLTYVRYTGAWKASYQGFLYSPGNGRLAPAGRFPRTVPGLGGFWMAGHWVSPGGGLPTTVLTAGWAVQSICAQDGKTFEMHPTS